MPFLNMELLKSPQNWVRVLVMLFLGLVLVFLLMHFFTPNSVETE